MKTMQYATTGNFSVRQAMNAACLTVLLCAGTAFAIVSWTPTALPVSTVMAQQQPNS